MRTKKAEKVIVPGIVLVSIAVPLLVLYLMYMPERNTMSNAPMGSFPFFHAVLNFCTTLVLISGNLAQRIGKIRWHRNLMIGAFFLSSVFLVSYVISKMSNDPVPYGGEGFLRIIYYFILITHILLSAIIIPLVLFTIYRGLAGQDEKHRRIARYTLPVWIYVSVTGVLVYVFMAPYY